MKRFFAVIGVCFFAAVMGLFVFYVFPVAADTLFGKSSALALAEQELETRGIKATLNDVSDYGDRRYGVIYLDGPRRIDVSIENGKVTRFIEWKNPHAK